MGKSVDAGKQVGKTPGWWEWSDDVNVNHVEACIGGREGGKRGYCVPLHLGSLAC